MAGPYLLTRPTTMRHTGAMLITGFGAFGRVEDNPSAHLARDLDPGATILRVDWREVAEFAQALPRGETILALGVAANRAEPTYELFAHNAADPRPDVDGEFWPLREIVPGAPASLGATFLTPEELSGLTMRTSYSPGGYLCNFILYRLLWELRGTGTRIGFVHVAPFEACPRETQLTALQGLVASIGKGGNGQIGDGSEGVMGAGSAAGAAATSSSSTMNS
ncbi:hypothetical protein EON77_13055 [bacterium]|nr:MAG: hypothetical protein EON77_13055 [bacterium]